jgi:hypothetical protein
MSGLLGITEQCGSGACAGLTGCKACAGQTKINQTNKTFFQTICYNTQQPTQLISHLHSFLSTNIVRSHTRDIPCGAEIIGGTTFLVRDFCDLSINGFFETIFGHNFDGRALGRFRSFQRSLKREASKLESLNQNKTNYMQTSAFLYVARTPATT